MQTICHYFHEQARWPTFDYLDRALTKERDDFEVVTVAAHLESAITDASWYIPIRGWDPERAVPLTITTLYTCYTEDLCPELGDDFYAFTHIAHGRLPKFCVYCHSVWL